LVPLLLQSENSEHVFWLGSVFELLLEIAGAMQAKRAEKVDIETLKPSKMNRLQRSLVKERVPAVAKDSTVNVSAFLVSALKGLQSYLQTHTGEQLHWKAQKNALTSLLRYWWETFYLSTSIPFEESTFQAHLAIGLDLLKRLPDTQTPTERHNSFIYSFEKSLQQNFDSGFKLTTGLSMELLWKQFRPITIPNLVTMTTLVDMEQLATRFDALRWKTTISTSELGGIMKSLVRAYHLILTSDVDGTALVKTLNEEMEKLESGMGKAQEEDGLQPFLSKQFEALRQFKTLKIMGCAWNEEEAIDVDIVVLASHPTISQMRLSASSKTSRLLQSVDYLWSLAGDGLQPVLDTFSVGMLKRLNGIGEVDLKSLRLLESELPVMGQKLALSSAILCKDQIHGLNSVLSILLRSVIGMHEESAELQFDQWIDSPSHNSLDLQLSDLQDNVLLRRQETFLSSDMPVQLQQVLTDYFNAVAVSISPSAAQSPKSIQFSAFAWINFALGCITLYVPDRAFDPDKRQRLERQRHEKTRSELQNKLDALRQFERLFSGQESNLRCQLLENDLSELGEAPEILLEIYRPEVSEMDQLQGEFGNLLKAVLGSNLPKTMIQYFEDGDVTGLQQIRLMQSNVTQIIRRLSERFRAYNDLTAPVVSMLRCLQIGLSIATLSGLNDSTKNEICLALSKMTPFLGGGPNAVTEDLLSQHPSEYLSLLSATAATEKLSGFDQTLRQSLLKTFHSCYEQWTKRLESDRLEAESKTGLYRFRGTAEDEEEDDREEFNEMFPDYDDESDVSKGAAPPSAVRGAAVELARVHASIFLGNNAPSESILGLVRHISKQIGSLHYQNANSTQQNMTAALLPGTLLLINDQIEALSPSASVPSSYNFYTDANLPEARKLVTLVNSIQSRFRDLQAVDEIGHMQPLADVLTSCRELLQFRHTEPLAKIITKVEKVHTFIHEWQFGGWASRVNSALGLYDDLTQTIVSWRRLELSTWAKLFDMETQKCEDDARSWWFVAYQVIIAAPLQISGLQEELKVYAQKLLKDLELYFSTAILGQYVQRLQLLKQLEQHLQLIVKDVPSMSIIRGALSNFIALYSRYERPVQEHLKKARVSLEKPMRDVLLLASWKDTNIVALRDSAKRSHHKLFKIVRKFRALLGQPMEFILKQGLPDEPSTNAEQSDYEAPIQYPNVDLSALSFCASSVPNWSQKSKRFINVSKTVSMMADASQLHTSAIDGSAYLDSFLANIITSAAELQKATPSILTQDNKDTVKHLKNRKRKLFADTLKELRQMGIKYNLGANALSKQDSLSMVLANVDVVGDIEILGLEYYFHKAIDLAPRVREAVKQHSEDLSSAEVARSTGFLEGLLQALSVQRNSLSGAITGMRQLETIIKMAKGLWAPGTYDIKVTTSVSNHEKTLRWLPNILLVALDLVKIHSKLGKIESKDVLDCLSSWVDRLTDFTRQWDAVSELPTNIVSTQRLDLEKAIASATQELNSQLNTMTTERPELGFVLSQISPWTEINISSASDEFDKPKTITDLDQKLSTVCDIVLVAIEKHQKTLVDLPSSSEDSGWLVNNETCLANSIKSLHSENVTNQIGQAFDVLRSVHLEDESTSKIAGAVFAVAIPILQQYYNTLQQAITRYGRLHRATCKAAYILAKTFTQIATQGFCTPSEKSDAQDGKTEKLEGGTGLGDGEGAEDISKDIQDDENLDELAQEPNKDKEGEIEDEKDAVDMADGDMEGEMGDAEEKGEDEEGSGGESGDENEMDEEAGDVDDLDPTAVDEKMWDGDGEQAKKDQEGDNSKSKASKDEQVAAQENDKQGAQPDDDDEGEEEEMTGAEQGEEVKQDEVEKHDPHAQEGEALDLPEDMELDGAEEEGSVSGSDDGMDGLSDVEEDGKEIDEATKDGREDPKGDNMDTQEEQETQSDLDVIDLDDEPEGEGEQTEEAGEKAESDLEEQQPEDEEGLLRDRNDEANADADNAVPSDVQGVGEDQDENSTDDKTESASKAQREDGGKGGDSSEQKDAAAEDGEKGRQANGDAPQDARDETQDSAAAQPFKKLGDALESWHRQQSKIREPAERKEQGQDQNRDMNAESSEFQHLQDEDAQADTQALGTATEEQAHALDESMAVDSETKEMPDQFQPDEIEGDDMEHDDIMDLEDPSTQKDQDTSDAYEGRAGAMIKQAKEEREEDLDDTRAHARQDLEEDVEEVDRELESTHLDNSFDLSPRSAADARAQWTHYESLTRDLSLSLTEQLRLILAPTLATKMRGDFRTGKRLNIKRIIPYIASQYKRDKIWMRRSVPSKRNYQIMLAVDDSKSMGESGSGSLAFETLVMVSKSLSMLEVGQICVVGFGENVRVAHDFETPFSSDAGLKVFQNFGFDQPRTDVTKLIRESIEHFRTARAKANSSPTDLWQMELIISDGVCDSSEHEPIRRLLREAIEERIMMVFVIVDDVKNKKKGESVMDLKEAKFVKNEMTGQSEVKIERYLDTFPFQYYLVVSDVKELPGVLATLLRQWFAEVVDSSI
jgi:midasin